MLRQGAIVLVSLHPTKGHEQRGQRPVLVVSSTHFNEVTRAPVVLPITTGGNFARTAGFAVELSGMKTRGVIRCDQPRVLDLVARKGQFFEKVPDETWKRPMSC
jgi:mRNA interferase ChpB